MSEAAHEISADAAPAERIMRVWDEEEERKLYDAFRAGAALSDIAVAHDRSERSIRIHLQVMGLVDLRGAVVMPCPDFAPGRVTDTPERRGLVWSVEEERRLYDAFRAGGALSDIATAHDRTRGGIRSHLQVMGLLDDDGVPVEPPPDFAPTAAALKRIGREKQIEEKRVAKRAVAESIRIQRAKSQPKKSQRRISIRALARRCVC